ncbi:DUF1289 domain-containing protein [Ramlibacter sp.]|uniref:DUF1289 domain-containing protein n=1 Tax=Ramlibacter sp. TaxID=1917967 RepID=UPI002CF72691|nr:DUF1289 domain-containing protein [Ramlibacter sp.]HWI81049.1 DUF1289 domain-containing protein [Ramlibacter sp.]
MAAHPELEARARAVAAAPAGEVPSPCVSICRMDPASGLCEGCCRTIDEIAAWSRLDDAGRREVWRRIGQRARLDAAGSGRRAVANRAAGAQE